MKKNNSVISDEDRFRKFIKDSKWIFAKTFAKSFPHDYCLRENSVESEFEWAVLYIRKAGREEPFWRKVYIYLYIDGYKYWTMGSPVAETILINRVEN